MSNSDEEFRWAVDSIKRSFCVACFFQQAFIELSPDKVAGRIRGIGGCPADKGSCLGDECRGGLTEVFVRKQTSRGYGKFM